MCVTFHENGCVFQKDAISIVVMLFVSDDFKAARCLSIEILECFWYLRFFKLGTCAITCFVVTFCVITHQDHGVVLPF